VSVTWPDKPCGIQREISRGINVDPEMQSLNTKTAVLNMAQTNLTGDRGVCAESSLVFTPTTPVSTDTASAHGSSDKYLAYNAHWGHTCLTETVCARTYHYRLCGDLRSKSTNRLGRTQLEAEKESPRRATKSTRCREAINMTDAAIFENRNGRTASRLSRTRITVTD